MKLSNRLISALAAFVMVVAPVYLSAAAKDKSKTEKVVQGSVIVATDSNLIIRNGKADMTLLYDSASQKPAALAPGTSVLVHYRDEKNKRIVTTVEMATGKTSTGQ
jgi:hypothetical protein